MKTIKKINLLVTVIGITTFIIGNVLQLINLNAETETVIKGLNELTYFGTIILGLSLIVWLIIVDQYVFTDWNWLKTRTKADDVAALSVFVMCVPILLSLITFILYDMVSWYDWYTVDNAFEPLYNLIYSSLRHLESDMTFWFIFISSISISSGLAIFLYKAKIKKIEEENQTM